MQIATLLYSSIALATCVAIYLALKKSSFSKLNKYEISGLKKLDELISSVGGIEKAKFYTGGHPYVWVEATYQEIRDLVLYSCAAGKFRFPIPASFLHKVDKEHCAIYVVVTNKPSIEDLSLQHYGEWLNSNAKHAEAISKYKKSH